MKKRLIAVLLCAVLLISVIPVASASYSGVNYGKIVEHMVNYFKGKEGDYGTVSPYDSNACSIGILQWHGVRALRLLRRVTNKNKTQSQNILGSTLYNEVLNASESSWKTRRLTSDEAKRVSKLLETAEGIKSQDEQAYEDITGYVDHGYRLGIRTDPALMYFCDIENHYGSGGCEGVVKKVKTGLGISTITSLDQFHNGVAKYVNAYMTRRNSTYSYIKNTLGYNTTGALVTLPGTGVSDPANDPDPAPAVTEPVVDDPNVCIGCPGTAYKDMPAKDNWAHVGIEFVIESGLFVGTSDTTFEPNTAMSRAMVVTVLYRLSGQSVTRAPKYDGSKFFSDVPAGSWYNEAVGWAATVGIISSKEGVFYPNQAAERELMATMFRNFTAYKKYTSKDPVSIDSFQDAKSVSGYAVNAMKWAVGQGLISGRVINGKTVLDPRGGATRAEVASIFMRYVMNIIMAQELPDNAVG